jgi:hypothetical protein
MTGGNLKPPPVTTAIVFSSVAAAALACMYRGRLTSWARLFRFTMVFTPRLLAALTCAAASVSLMPAKNYRVTVAAADVDRAVQVVTFQLPPDALQSNGLTQGNGTVLPLQRSPEGRATFIIPAQRAGETLSFSLREGPLEKPAVQTTPGKGRLHVSVQGKPVFDYQMDKDALPRADIPPEYKRAGYLHPIHTPSGTIVSDDYPAQHIHHHGIWSPWTLTSFQGRSPDFWNMGKKSGTVEFVALDRSWSGPVHGGFVARHRFIDLSAPAPVVVLHETWEVTAYNAPPNARVFDLTLTQTCATSDPLLLPKYHYGGLGFRGRGEWLGKDKANFLTSDGETDRVKANARKMRWVHLSGALDRGPAGLAVLGHPANFRAPQPVRVHPNEPYVSFTPSQDGDWSIEPGKPYVARYRFVAADGAPDRRSLDALWNAYSIPAVVNVVAENPP